MSHQEVYLEENLTIRDAVKEDMMAVSEMVQELANSTNMPHAPKLSVKDWENYGFGMQPPAFQCKIAENTSDKAPLGYALYFPTYSTWEGRGTMLEDLYVRPSHGERQGSISKKLFHSVVSEAIKLGSSRLDFHLMQQNPSCVYYEKKGAVNLSDSEDWVYYRLGLRGSILKEIQEKEN